MPRKNNSSSGQVPASTATTRYSGIGQSSPDGRANFTDCPAQLLAAAIETVTSLGDAMMFGRTSDGGAVVITILSGQERIKAYSATQGELDEALAVLAGIEA